MLFLGKLMLSLTSLTSKYLKAKFTSALFILIWVLVLHCSFGMKLQFLCVQSGFKVKIFSHNFILPRQRVQGIFVLPGNRKFPLLCVFKQPTQFIFCLGSESTQILPELLDHKIIFCRSKQLIRNYKPICPLPRSVSTHYLHSGRHGMIQTITK